MNGHAKFFFSAVPAATVAAAAEPNRFLPPEELNLVLKTGEILRGSAPGTEGKEEK